MNTAESQRAHHDQGQERTDDKMIDSSQIVTWLVLRQTGKRVPAATVAGATAPLYTQGF